jgi:hypothetical protein
LFESCHRLAVERWPGQVVTITVDSTRRAAGDLAIDCRVCVQSAQTLEVIATIFPRGRHATHEEAITALRRLIAANAWTHEAWSRREPVGGEA